MSYTTLISPAQLKALIDSGAPLQVFDCSFDLMKPAEGAGMYQQGHIPGAVHADLNTALSVHDEGAARSSGGRHPLPTPEDFAHWLASSGFSNNKQAVVYDRNGTNYCGRLWWMLKWAGHDAVAVLDGGLQAWQAAGGAVSAGAEPALPTGNFTAAKPLRTLVQAGAVLADMGKPGQTIIDARAGPRFRGETEPLDPVAGHIPGALNRPFSQNFDESGRFKAPEVLRAEFEALLGGHAASTVVHHCGSGVSAIPNVLAMEIAGLGSTALFAGSWSEWCADPSRPVAQG